MFGLGRAPAPAPADAVPYLPSSPGQQSESAEIAELQQLFSSRGPYPPPRDSTIPKTTLAKLKVGEELLLHADEARQEKEDRRRVREAQMSERLARAQTRREESKQRTERCRAAYSGFLSRAALKGDAQRAAGVAALIGKQDIRTVLATARRELPIRTSDAENTTASARPLDRENFELWIEVLNARIELANTS